MSCDFVISKIISIICSMKSEEKPIQAISAQAHSEAADNRLLRKKLQARGRRVVELEAMVSNLNKQLCEKVDQLNEYDAKTSCIHDW